jgi:response regulator RpfG family c-di-GMP phosphodiesterase
MTDAQVANILIVGESDASESHVRGLLAAGSFRCTCTSRTSEACLIAREPWLDAALVDASTIDPGEALRLTTWLRQEVPSLPVVLVDGNAPAHGVFEALRLGVIDYLRLPVTPEEIGEAVDRAVRWRRDAQSAIDAAEHSAREMLARCDALVRASVETGIESSVALKAWLADLYQRDGWTADHVRRVADLAVLIGTMLGVDSPTLEQIERAALLHDVGRLAVPDGLLRKPGPLTDDERTLIRTHVQVAYEIASASPFLEPVATTLFAVRERYDGSVYPLGLIGEAIPLPARIIAVAEGLDTLGSAAGSEPGDADVVHATLVRDAGACFDPAIVRAWLRCVDSGVLTGAGARGTHQW